MKIIANMKMSHGGRTYAKGTCLEVSNAVGPTLLTNGMASPAPLEAVAVNAVSAPQEVEEEEGL